MIEVDGAGLALGLLAGGAAGAAFFAGLAAGLRLALRRANPGPLLLLSAALRIAALLACVRVMAPMGAAALAGFALGFLLVRSLAIALARTPKAKTAAEGGRSWS